VLEVLFYLDFFFSFYYFCSFKIQDTVTISFNMAVSGIISRFKPRAVQEEGSEPSMPSGSASFVEKNGHIYDDSPVKYLTWRSFVLGVLASMGGFIFGYSTGGFLGY
jgi:SP family sugar:H+ symporter-like MFS transporter